MPVMSGNSKLLSQSSVEQINVSSASPDVIASSRGEETATAYIIDNVGANKKWQDVGDKTIKDFNKNDSILSEHKIYDGNGDNIIDFGDGVLDVNRSGDGDAKAGGSQFVLEGLGSEALRYLGFKDYYVYADASTRLAGMTEGTVGNDTFDAGAGAKTYLYDNALGLNLGGDKINNFGFDDYIVTTRPLYDSNTNNYVDFGTNGFLDISGQVGPRASDPEKNPGGQLDINGVNDTDVTRLYLASVDSSRPDVTYYYYNLGLVPA